MNRATKLTAKLNNRDGRFTMQNPASPYFPNVEPRRPCRWVTTWNGVDYPRFEGLIEALPTEWSDFSDETVTVTAVGRLGALAEIDLPGSVWETTVRGLVPRNWYQLDDPDPLTVATDSGFAVNPLLLSGPMTKADGADMIPGGARQFNPVTTYAFQSELGTVADSLPWTIVLVCKLDLTRPATNTSKVTLPLSIIPKSGSGGPVFEIRHTNAVDSAGLWNNRISFKDIGPPIFTREIMFVSSLPPYNAFFPEEIRDDWFVIVIRRLSGELTVFMDDVIAAPFSAPTTYPSSTIIKLGGETSDAGRNSIDEVVGWSTPLTDVEVRSVINAVRHPWENDTAFGRYTRVIATLGIPVSRFVRGTEDVSPLGQTKLGGKALPYLHRLARSARGRLLDTNVGKVLLRTGGDLGLRRESQVTFSSLPGVVASSNLVTETPDFIVTESGDRLVTGSGATELPYEKVGTDPSLANIVTTARAKNVDGTLQVADATDIVPGTLVSYLDRYGRRGPPEGEITDLLLKSDAQALSFARWVVDQGKTPTVALDPLVLHPLGEDQVTWAALSLDLDDVVTVKKKHPAQSQTVTAVCRIAGISETVSVSGRRRSWRCEWRLEPLEPL